MTPDYRIENHGTIFLVRPQNDRARQHLQESISADAQWFGDALAVEHRYARDLAAGLIEEGFTVR